MGIADSYRVLADAIEALEDRGIDVTGVDQECDADDLSVTIDCRIPGSVDGGTRATTDAVSAPGKQDEERETPRTPEPRHPLVGVPPGDRGGPNGERTRTDEDSLDREERESSTDPGDRSTTVGEGPDDADLEPARSKPAPSSDGTSTSERDDAPADGTSADADSADDAPADADPSDGEIPCRSDDCGATFGNEHGMKIHYSKVHRDDGETPPYEDPEALREVYERHETFAEMTAALDVDVSSNTVRRYMIEHGIHDPHGHHDARSGADEPAAAAEDTESTGRDEAVEEGVENGDSTADSDEAVEPRVGSPSADDEGRVDPGAVESGAEGSGGNRWSADTNPSDDSSDADVSDDDSETKFGVDSDERPETNPDDGDDERRDDTYDVPDAVDLPRGVTVEDVAAAVTGASTVYEVGRDLRVSRERAHRLLRDLGLLDLVTGRLATRPDPDQVRREVDARLRDASGDTAVEAD